VRRAGRDGRAVAEVRRICEVAARVGCVGSMWFLVGGRAFGFVVVRSSVRMRVLLSQLMPQSHPNLPSRFDLIRAIAALVVSLLPPETPLR
jgi:hypothetical protein